MIVKKIITITTLGVALLVLSGCGSQDAAKKSDLREEKGAKRAAGKSVPENLPAATGSVDSAVDAIISASEDESAQAVGGTDEARAAAGETAEADNLSNIYDQNEF